jgi:hypothetical protein
MAIAAQNHGIAIFEPGASFAVGKPNLGLTALVKF